MSNKIVKQLRDEAQRPAISEMCHAAADELERLRLLIHAYAAAADGIVLNWVKDRHGNWGAFDNMHHALLEEASRG